MKLSIITINFNDKKGLEKTIKSVTSQSFNDMEYIVIDGGSTDGSCEVIKEHVSNIDHWVSESDNGIFNAMNKGLDRSSGEYCLFLNSGDYLLDGVLHKVFANDLTDDIAYGDLRVKSGEACEDIAFPEYITFFNLFTAYLPHPSTFIKKRCFEAIGGYDEKYAIVSDWAFFAKAIGKYNFSTKHIPLTISCHSLGGISSQPQHNKRHQEERQLFLKNEFPAFYDDYMELMALKNLSRKLDINLMLSLKKIIKNVIK